MWFGVGFFVIGALFGYDNSKKLSESTQTNIEYIPVAPITPPSSPRS